VSDFRPVYCVNVIDKRDVSNWIAETYGIKHESPQVLCIREGEVLRVWNHFEVKKGELEAV